MSDPEGQGPDPAMASDQERITACAEILNPRGTYNMTVNVN